MAKGKNRKLTLEMVYDRNNMVYAEKEARRGKSKDYGPCKFRRNYDANIDALCTSIKDRTYRTMNPVFEERFCEDKWRTLSKVYYDYHVAHHALMRVIMPTLMRSYHYESAASITGRGIHYSTAHVRKWIDRYNGSDLWWVQMDFVKFYHHIKRQKIYDRLCKTFSDEGIRWLLHDVIWALGKHNGLGESDGTEGMGIGLYPVQPLVNYYLNDFDRMISRFGCFYCRYCDNMLLIGDDPKKLWKAVEFTKQYAKNVLEQPMHTNIGVQKLDDVHPVDYCGYLFYPDHTLIRKRTKYRFKRKYNQYKDDPERLKHTLNSYKGWLQHCNGLHLWNTVTGMKSFNELNVQLDATTRDGHRYFEVPAISASFLVGRRIIVKDFEDNVSTKNGTGRMCVLVEENGSDKKFLTNNPRLKDILYKVREMDEFPFEATFRSRTISGGKIDYYFE